jgi:protoporphyrin/coproporphyrin ferrochelatase
MTFQIEPKYSHTNTSTVGVLLCNLGTPDEATPAALRRYLGEFLSDHRVVEIPKLIWWLILHGIILRFRPSKSAQKYASIWMKEGSPLRVWTQRQAVMLGGYMGERGHANLQVRYGMRYGNPSMASQLDAMKAAGCTRILIVPSYPQYSGTTTASVLDAVYSWGQRTRRVPEFRFINNYHDHPDYIGALAARVKAHFQSHGKPQVLVLSFHGVPERTLKLGDPYHCECYKTARLLREHLGLPADMVKVTFQSRFGKAKWLEPYTEPSLIELAKTGTEHVAVMCPGFTVDCLETLEEIQMEAKEAFLHAGGKQFDYIECLNDSPQWISALSNICAQHLQGWPTQVPDDVATRQAQAAAAKEMNAAS